VKRGNIFGRMRQDFEILRQVCIDAESFVESVEHLSAARPENSEFWEAQMLQRLDELRYIVRRLRGEAQGLTPLPKPPPQLPEFLRVAPAPQPDGGKEAK
jgi:hypothetical protein